MTRLLELRSEYPFMRLPANSNDEIDLYNDVLARIRRVLESDSSRDR